MANPLDLFIKHGIDFLFKLIGRPIYVSLGGVSTGNFIGTIAAVASAIAAGCAACATHWQGRLQKQGLKQNLFAHRLEVYHTARAFLSGFMGSNDDPDDLQSKAIKLLRETKAAGWLFGPEVDVYIKKLYSAAIAFSSDQRLALTARRQNRMLNEQQQNEFNQRLAWLTDAAHTEAYEVFKEYLRLHESKR